MEHFGSVISTSNFWDFQKHLKDRKCDAVDLKNLTSWCQGHDVSRRMSCDVSFVLVFVADPLNFDIALMIDFP